MQKFNDLLSEYKASKTKIKAAEEYIQAKTEEYNKSILIPTGVITEEKIRTKNLGSTTVPVRLKDYVESLTEIWGVEKSQVNARIIFESFNGEYSLEEVLEFYTNDSIFYDLPDFMRDMSLLVRAEKNNRNKTACINNPVSSKTFDEAQYDGRPLIEHVKTYVKNQGKPNVQTTLVCDDYENIIFSYELSDFYKIIDNEDFQTSENMALLEAAKKFKTLVSVIDKQNL